MQGIKIDFEIKSLPASFVACKNGQKSLEIKAEENKLIMSVAYDYDTRPLALCAEIKAGDIVEAIFYEYRIELYINGVLVDEEWPAGKMLYNLGDEILGNLEINVSEFSSKEEKGPSVISTFENAEGWRPGNGVFVGDCMPYVNDGRYHVLYLKDRHHHKSKWGMGAHQWEHISTSDFKSWQVHPMAVPITNSEEASICTGSFINGGDKQYLYYTIRRGKGLPAIVARSASYDGYHFEKDTAFGFVVSEKYNSQVARDPKVFKGEDGVYHMILTTVFLEEDRGCLAHYISNDLEKWQECDAPLYKVENSDHPECPDYFKYKGKYYLVFSIRGRARYLVSNKPFEGFEQIDNSLIPCAGVPKCAEWNGKLIFTGFEPIDGYAGTMTFKSATADKDGKLIFENL